MRRRAFIPEAGVLDAEVYRPRMDVPEKAIRPSGRKAILRPPKRKKKSTKEK